jgi:hypothetical protein
MYLFVCAGGSGKTRVVTAIQDFFTYVNASSALRVTATTGAAASLINGSTINAALGINTDNTSQDHDIGTRKCTDPTKKQRQRSAVRFLIVDEVSMMSLSLLIKIDAQLKIVKSNERANFGGVNIIFVGDFYQHPPVSGGALFTRMCAPEEGVHPNEQRHIHQPLAQCTLWNSFTFVILLDVQHRLEGNNIKYAI